MRLCKKPIRLTRVKIFWGKFIVHFTVLGYLTALLIAGLFDRLGADPVKTLIHNSGLTAVILLLLTLTISPLAKHLPCADMMKFRRLMGIYSFTAAMYHLLIFALFDLQLNWSLLLQEIVKRPYITVGMAALSLLLAMTCTSTLKIRRKMGPSWQALHNTIYLCLVLAMIHYTWSEKISFQSSLIYWLLASVVLSFRIPVFFDRCLRVIKAY